MEKSTWQARIREHLAASGALLRRMTPGMTYGALSAATLMPLISTVQGGELAALFGLANIVGGIGGNLIANQIQSWQDRSEEEIARDLEQLADKPEWQDALDKLIEELETPRIVQETFSEADWRRFQDLLRQELAELGNLPRYEIYFSQINTDGGAVVEGDVTVHNGNFVGRDQVTNHNYAAPPDPSIARAADAEQAYLRRLFRRCNVLPLASLGGDESGGDEVTLSDVYVDLDTLTAVDINNVKKVVSKPNLLNILNEKIRPLSALEAATQHHRLVLLGDPGSGKSTFVRQLCARLAAVWLGEPAKAMPDWPTDLFPLYTELRELTPKLAAVDLNNCATAERDERLVQVLVDHWQAELVDERAGRDLAARLDRGDVLIVLDGLDEVPVEQRERVRLMIAALARLHRRVQRVIVTCRVRSYTDAVRLANFDVHQLAPFDEEKIGNFCQAWYLSQVAQGHFKQEAAVERSRNLSEAAQRQNLAELARNPMLLTTMAIIHQKEVGLPDERVKLYQQAVDVLMRRWQRARALSTHPAVEALLGDERKLRLVLERLAFAAHHKRGAQEADLPRSELLVLLEDKDLLGDVGAASAFLAYVDHRAGLLVGKGGDEAGDRPLHYSFPHRTFQEYLAGCYLLRGRGVGRNFWQKAAEGDSWSLAAMLAAEELYYNNAQRGETGLLDLIYYLCPETEPADAQGWRALVWSAQMSLLPPLAVIEQDTDGPAGGQIYLARLRRRLVQLLNEGHLTPLERFEGGRSLGKSGDPRPGVGVKNGLPNIEWVPIAAGPFLMGSVKEQDRDAYDDELPQFTCGLIDQPYRIARFPVTVAQYECFITAGGYAEPRFWTKAGWAWRNQNGIDRPERYQDVFQTPNHPQVGVSWYEAVAFCNWMSEELGYPITLPSEAQWERAARHTDGRIYPWPGKFAVERCNSAETGIGSTSAVGAFPAGVAECGALDMSGNVWEWCSTKWLENYKGYENKVDDDAAGDSRRVLRGGSFHSSPVRYVRCAYRLIGDPLDRYYDIGFRVLSPGL
jgi:formylglycine-generating enzyme required for sulfatase activity